ncbi:MAG: GlsB/YeaQ/YmgE family stress response membrane protein [Defluviitaleaceae bacterium]|nr:GlsB/YeaQ/YmgE family stress response membrane protein [Defluviitaleaceae bacterium]
MDWLIGVLIWIVMGAIIGWLAGIVMKSQGSLLRNIIFGILGGALGGFVGGLLPFSFEGILGWVMGVVFAVAGASLLIFVASKLFK